MGLVVFIYFIFIFLRGVTFSIFFFILSILIFMTGIVEYYAHNSYMIEKLLIILKPVKYVLILLMLTFFIIETLIIYRGSVKELSKTDFIIIFGAGVRGVTPSLILNERLQSGLICINNNPKALVILSGGKGPGEDISEAEAMRRYLVKNGVNENRLIVEDKSRDTNQNILYSKNKLKERINSTNAKVLLVTSNFHMFRTGFLAKRAGLNALYYSSPIPTWLIPTYYIREYFAVIKSYIFDKTL